MGKFKSLMEREAEDYLDMANDDVYSAIDTLKDYVHDGVVPEYEYMRFLRELVAHCKKEMADASPKYTG